MADRPEHLSFITRAETDALEKAAYALEDMDLSEIPELLNATYAPVLQDGETMPDWAFEIELDRRLIAYLATNAMEGDQERRSAVKRRQDTFVKRDRGAVVVRRDLWQLAVRIETHYGRGVLRILGLAGPRPKTPKVILDLAILVRKHLRSEWFEFPPTTLDEREPLDRFELAAELDKSIALMDTRFTSSMKQAESAVTALATKRDGQGDATLGRRTLIGRLRLLLELAKRPALAARLRLPVLRTQADDPPTDDPPTDDPPADDPPTDDPPADDPPDPPADDPPDPPDD